MSPSATLAVLLCLAVTAANAAVCPNLKSAANYAVVAYSGVTNTGPSVIKSKVAVYPIPSVIGFPPGTITGSTQLATPAAMQAQVDQTAAYTYCKNVPFTMDKTGVDLAGKTLTPGVYKFSTTAMISAAGTLTLKGTGVYIFQVGTAITTGAGTKIVLTNGAKAGCIFWQVGTSATLGASSTFVGNILAYASVTFGAGVMYKGSVYAQTGTVTLINDAITSQAKCSC